MKTARDLYPETSNELFEKASDWVGNMYSYVPCMEPARDGFIHGHTQGTKDLEAKLQVAVDFIEKLQGNYFFRDSLQAEFVTVLNKIKAK